MPKSDNEPHLGHKLLEAMELRGVKQIDVARHFDVKPPTVSSDWIKHGRIGKKHYPELVNYFGLPYEWWFGKAGEDQQINAVILEMLKMSKSEKDSLIRRLKGSRKTDKSHTDTAVDKAQAHPIELKPVPSPDKTRKKDSTFRELKAPGLVRPRKIVKSGVKRTPKEEKK